MTKLLVNFTRNFFYLLWLQISGYIQYILVLLFQLKLQENIVKVVSRYAVGSVTVYTIWRLFVFLYTCKPRHFDSREAAPTTPPSHSSVKSDMVGNAT